ncbi:mitochondrial ornithine carrier protein [Vermiconidia calcicola]|uniref:Mitochondrial ornithine carrier protein n=1 Tax=Vermiconidia calcicola TaxID=1690605 RepID=A0ACC3MQF2_9PEZI|nr:mitochondrial ornithine carrier protein [Vermiconidia calcicola]
MKAKPSFQEPPIPTIAEPAHIDKQATSKGIEALKDIAFGSIAGIAGKIVEYPFDTVKSIQQDGFRGLYRGVSAPFAGAAAETACLFWSYRVAQDVLRSFSGLDSGATLPLTGLVTAGALSGGLTSLILTPIELVKCRMQVPITSPLDPTLNSTQPLSPFAVIANVYRREGIRGFWRGQLGTFLRETGGTAAWFGAYEASTLFFKTRALQSQPFGAQSASDIQLPVHQQMASGALAGMSYNFIFYPADTIKSKIQTGELSTRGVRPTFMYVGKALWQSHGLKGLYRGCGITVARSAPSSALIFTIVENLKTAFA